MDPFALVDWCYEDGRVVSIGRTKTAARQPLGSLQSLNSGGFMLEGSSRAHSRIVEVHAVCALLRPPAIGQDAHMSVVHKLQKSQTEETSRGLTVTAYCI